MNNIGSSQGAQIRCVLALLFFCVGILPLAVRAAEGIGIYEKILEASGNFDETTAAFEGALATSPLVLHGKFDLNLMESGQHARVYLLVDPRYVEAAGGEPPETASAQLLRVAIYEVGDGRHTQLDIGNPTAHAMVFYAGSTHYSALLKAARAAADNLRAVASKVPGTAVSVQLEPRRSEDDLNHFQGDGMAKMMAKWRNWKASQSVLFTETPDHFPAAVARIEDALRRSRDRGLNDPSGWRLIGKVPVGANAVVFGISNSYTEATSVRINSSSRRDEQGKGAQFPGVDHGPALPLEILVVNDGKQVRAVQYGEMWRMQLYFWDSGYLAFAQNAGVPGTLFDSIASMISSSGGSNSDTTK